MMRKAHEAKLAGAASFTIWGSGTPRREFLHVDDLADACVFLMRHYSGELPINVGSGSDIPIIELAGLVARTVGFAGAIVRDETKPDGTPRKLLDVSRLRALGWQPDVELRDGIEDAYRWYTQNHASARL